VRKFKVLRKSFSKTVPSCTPEGPHPLNVFQTYK